MGWLLGRFRGSVFQKWFEDLGKGDPIAWGIALLFGVLAGIFGLLILKVGRDLRKDDEAFFKRYGRKPPKT